MQTLEQLQNGALKGSVSLKLSDGLKLFPPEILELADTLEFLDLTGNQLSELPHDFGRLKKLRILFCSDNLFTVFPEVLADCPELDIVGFKSNFIETVPARSLNSHIRWLILTNNNIVSLPAQIGKCSRMEKLALAGNKLTALPQELSNCRDLGLLRISANRLTELPSWLLSMPKLSWLAFSGNFFNVSAETEVLPFIDWSDLDTRDLLGEGASGIIYKAILHKTTEQKEVAVKVFKGAVTSDGLPEDEMQTFIAAGVHDGMPHLIGQVSGHPDGRKGLVMELIPRHFYNLGMPPNFDSCTRDVFREGMQLSVEQIVKIAGTVASVAAQLHDRGIMHGDLYAHNTLVDAQGNTMFGDFGAACFYDKTDKEVAFALERIEVSAFGHLLDDLLSLCKETDNDATLTKLKLLRDDCTKLDVSLRPDFQYLYDELMVT